MSELFTAEARARMAFVTGASQTLTCSVEDSRVRTSVTLATEKALTENAPAFGLSLLDSLARFDPDTSSWKTSQRCLVEGLDEFSETWPRAGMTRNGIAFQRQPLVPLTDVIDCGWLPTPTAQGGENNKSASSGASVRPTLETMARKAQWPTPTASERDATPKRFMRGNLNLAAAVRWPTPRAADWKGASSHTACVDRRIATGEANLPESVQPSTPGQLNPTWVEWLMGYPLGWTDLGDSATPSSRK